MADARLLMYYHPSKKITKPKNDRNKALLSSVGRWSTNYIMTG